MHRLPSLLLRRIGQKMCLRCALDIILVHFILSYMSNTPVRNWSPYAVKFMHSIVLSSIVLRRSQLYCIVNLLLSGYHTIQCYA